MVDINYFYERFGNIVGDAIKELVEGENITPCDCGNKVNALSNIVVNSVLPSLDEIITILTNRDNEGDSDVAGYLGDIKSAIENASGHGDLPEPEVSPIYHKSLTATINDESVTRECIVDEDGKLIVISDSSNKCYIYKSNTNPDVWSIDGTLDNITAFGTAAGDVNEISGTINENNVTFRLDDVNVTIISGNITPIPKFLNGGGVTPSPTPILAEGVVQVFNDEACSEYFDGQSNVCYVRLNNGLNKNGERRWQGSSDNQDMWLSAPSDEEPGIPYAVHAYFDYFSNELEGPLVAGTVIRCATEVGWTVSNPMVIFE